MKVLIVFLLFLTEANAGRMYTRMIGKLLCNGKPFLYETNLLEYDLYGPPNNIYSKKWYGAFDISVDHYDSFLPRNELELELIIRYTCNGCQDLIEYASSFKFQFESKEKARNNPENLGTFEVSERCVDIHDKDPF